MKDSQRLAQMIKDCKHYLSNHDLASLDQLVQGGEAIEWQPIAKRIFVSLLILENNCSFVDGKFIRSLYADLKHGCDVELFRSVYLS